MKIIGISKMRWRTVKNTKYLGRRHYKARAGRWLVYARDESDRFFTFRISGYAVFYWKLRKFLQSHETYKVKSNESDDEID